LSPSHPSCDAASFAGAGSTSTHKAEEGEEKEEEEATACLQQMQQELQEQVVQLESTLQHIHLGKVLCDEAWGDAEEICKIESQGEGKGEGDGWREVLEARGETDRGSREAASSRAATEDATEAWREKAAELKRLHEHVHDELSDEKRLVDSASLSLGASLETARHEHQRKPLSLEASFESLEIEARADELLSYIDALDSELRKV
jgi:hypothetical protein